MRGAIGSCLTLLVATVASAADPPATIDPAWRERARTEGRAAYEKYMEVAKRLEEVSEIRHEHNAETGSVAAKFTLPPHTRREWSVRDGDNAIQELTLMFDGAPGPPPTSLKCDNAAYHFTLHKGPAGYSLVEYKPGRRELALKDQEGGIYAYAYSPLDWAIKAIDGEDKHTLKAIHRDESKKLLRIAHAYQSGEKISTKELWVDPEHNWRVAETRTETMYGVHTGVTTYGIQVAGLDFPTGWEAVSHYKVEESPPEERITGRVISLKVADRPPEGFRLSAFGLPEPVDAPPLEKRTPLYIWFLAGAAALGLIAIGFRYLARQRAASSPA